MKFLIWGKGKVGQGVRRLLNYLNVENVIEDDNSFRGDLKSYVSKFDKIVVSPGIKPIHKIYKFGNDKIIGELDLIWYLIKKLDLKDIHFIGITGTDGKSTATWKIYNILKEYLDDFYDIYIGGNFDTPVSSLFLDYLKNCGNRKPSIFVLEVSSFMAYNLKNLKFIASFWINFEVDHLDWHIDLQDYRRAKQNLLRNTIGVKIPSVGLGKKIVFFKMQESSLIEFVKELLSIFGKKIKKEDISRFLNKIKPLPHRFQLIKHIGNIKIYDDGKCTTANCQAYALSRLKGKCVLICGGFDKGIDYSKNVDLYIKKVSFVALFGDIGKKLKELFDKVGIRNKYFGKDFNETIEYSIRYAKEKGIENILFSPGASSFDMFSNRKERAEKFVRIIEDKFK